MDGSCSTPLLRVLMRSVDLFMITVPQYVRKYMQSVLLNLVGTLLQPYFLDSFTLYVTVREGPFRYSSGALRVWEHICVGSLYLHERCFGRYFPCSVPTYLRSDSYLDYALRGASTFLPFPIYYHVTTSASSTTDGKS